MSAAIRAVVMEHRIPAGALGPEPVTLDVRAYLVTHATGVILVDTQVWMRAAMPWTRRWARPVPHGLMSRTS
jgi:hypothetical protein